MNDATIGSWRAGWHWSPRSALSSGDMPPLAAHLLVFDYGAGQI